MKLTTAIDEFIADWRAQGRIRSPLTERTYRDVLELHAQDAGNRDPRTIGRVDVKRTLARWENQNTRRSRHAALTSFYDWTMEEGIRKDNPARQVRRSRRQPVSVYRLTRAEAAAMMAATRTVYERRIVHIGICAGLRNAELRGLRGANLARRGYVWVSADIAKGGRERWVPVLAELELTVAEIRAHVGLDDHVLPRLFTANPGVNTRWNEDPTHPMSGQSVGRIVDRVAQRAGIRAHIHPHLMRHAFADHVARAVDLQAAQALLGHADISTTQGYVGRPTLDDLTDALAGMTFAYPKLPPDDHPATAPARPAGFEPADADNGAQTVGGIEPPNEET